MDKARKLRFCNFTIVDKWKKQWIMHIFSLLSAGHHIFRFIMIETPTTIEGDIISCDAIQN